MALLASAPHRLFAGLHGDGCHKDLVPVISHPCLHSNKLHKQPTSGYRQLCSSCHLEESSPLLQTQVDNVCVVGKK